jgi:hypothetical protein
VGYGQAHELDSEAAGREGCDTYLGRLYLDDPRPIDADHDTVTHRCFTTRI